MPVLVQIFLLISYKVSLVGMICPTCLTGHDNMSPWFCILGYFPLVLLVYFFAIHYDMYKYFKKYRTRNHRPSKWSPKASTVRCQRCGRRRIPPTSSICEFWHLLIHSCSTSILTYSWVPIALCVITVKLTPLLQCLCTISAILTGAHYNFVVSSFKCEGKKLS